MAALVIGRRRALEVMEVCGHEFVSERCVNYGVSCQPSCPFQHISHFYVLLTMATIRIGRGTFRAPDEGNLVARFRSFAGIGGEQVTSAAYFGSAEYDWDLYQMLQWTGKLMPM